MPIQRFVLLVHVIYRAFKNGVERMHMQNEFTANPSNRNMLNKIHMIHADVILQLQSREMQIKDNCN